MRSLWLLVPEEQGCFAVDATVPTQVAILASALSIERTVLMSADVRQGSPARLVVAGAAHALGIVLASVVWAINHSHRP
jgi:glycerol dehydrogenase-like iron-containing ADH family enzyme